MNNEQVGKISYVVEIDTAALKDGSKTIEQAVTGSLKGVERATDSASKKVDAFTKRLNAAENALKPIASASAVASGAVVAGFGLAANAAFQQVRAVENASFGLRAYEKDAQSVNTVLGQLIQFARSDAGVLFQREELFQAASTLKGFGEATSQLNDRVQILAKGVAVGNTTFAELSQIVGRSAQQGQLTAEAFDQLAYRGIILDASLRGAAVGADQLYTAIDNAIDDSILSGRANTIDGLLVRLNSAWRDLGATILGVDRNTSQFIQGGLGSFIVQTISQITAFVRENQALIAGVGTGVIVFGALTGGLYIAVKAIAATRAALVALGVSGAVAQARLLGIIGAISAIAGVAAGFAIEQQLNNADNSLGDLNQTLDDTTNFSSAAADAAGDLAKQLKNIDEQASRVQRDYEENLARIVQQHQQSVKDLTEQIEKENVNYNNAVRKRLTDFEAQQGKEESAHQDKVDALRTQIDFLTKYNNTSNQTKLTQLQFALAREQSEYQKRNAERVAQYDADASAEEASYQQRLTENQARLAEELAFLNKHRSDVLSVRNTILLDEIESLKRSRAEQLKSLEEQRQDAVSSAAGRGAAAGAAYGNAYKTNLISSTKLSAEEAKRVYGGGTTGAYIQTYDRGGGKIERVIVPEFATGGFTGRGGKYDEAGIVHKGEYVVPKEQVNQATGLPDYSKIPGVGGGGSTTYEINVSLNPQGILATSPQAIRDFSNMVLDNINQTLKSKGIPALGAA